MLPKLRTVGMKTYYTILNAWVYIFSKQKRRPFSDGVLALKLKTYWFIA